jgi:hypothetical protein
LWGNDRFDYNAQTVHLKILLIAFYTFAELAALAFGTSGTKRKFSALDVSAQFTAIAGAARYGVTP